MFIVRQLTLFENTLTPNRIDLLPDFISEPEERDLIEHFKTIKWQRVEMHGVIAKRSVAHFGLDYKYTKRAVRKTDPAPLWLKNLTGRTAHVLKCAPEDLKEVLVTYYPAGSGIGWHKDAEVFGNAVIGVSFLNDCTMKFRHPETLEVFKLDIPRRSAYVFADEARWLWHHSISNHVADRYSVTFRTLVKP